MARNRRRSNRSRPNQRRRRVQRKRGSSSRSVLPPAKSILSNIFRSVIQSAWDVAQGALSASSSSNLTAINPSQWSMEDIKDDGIFASGNKKPYQQLFREYKVHKITAHYVPYAGQNEPGEYVFSLFDSGENNPDITSFKPILGRSASVVRKSYQPSRLTWFPTEPDDRNWHVFGDAHSWVSALISAAESNYHVQTDEAANTSTAYQHRANISGKIIVECDVSCRGRSDNFRQTLTSDAERALYADVIRCRCSKCLRCERLKQLRQLLASGTSAPHISEQSKMVPSPTAQLSDGFERVEIHEESH